MPKFKNRTSNGCKYVSIPKEIDPMAITLEQAVELINEKRSNEQKRHIKTFEEDNKLELLNGRYGPYIAFDGKNYRIPKAKQENVESLSYEECMTIIKEAPEPKARGRRSKKE
jgi:DNA topoisomerase-1